MAKGYNYVYWALPIFLFILQAFFTFNSLNQLRYEEIAESIRDVFWLADGLLYDGTSSNVGWYGPLLLIYELFGFDIHTAKYLRLAIELVSLFCLAAILKRYLGEKLAWLPLLTIGMSPTLLFYTTQQHSHGTDLQYFPIVFFLVINSRVWVKVLGWTLAMVAWMSYPTFIFYLPVLALIHLGGVPSTSLRAGAAHPRGVLLMGIVSSFVAFLIPLVLAFLLVKNPSMLVFDPHTSSGLFRGAGGMGLSLEEFSRNIEGLFADVFVKGDSYHYDLSSGEFSLIFPIISVVLVIFLAFKAKIGKVRGVWLAGYLLGMLMLASFTFDPSANPGMRRYTQALAAFYGLFVIAWNWANLSKRKVPSSAYHEGSSSAYRSNWAVKGGLVLLLIHHIIVYPFNLIHLKDPSPSAYPIWFTTRDTPRESLESVVSDAEEGDLKLMCTDDSGFPMYCRLSEIYAAVAGACLWNNLSCHELLGYDVNSGQVIPLRRELWNEYYFEH